MTKGALELGEGRIDQRRVMAEAGTELGDFSKRFDSTSLVER
ncbi:MAG TPA: hypothetical protein VFP53_01635 [Sphingomicrobium sp.]|nr:hypothetical protein [Sphingomicrobium sp.]